MRYLIATLLLSTLLFAQNDILEIDSIDFQGDDKKGISIFTGNVKVRMNQDRLNANKVEVYFETDKKTNNKTPLRYEATGDADFEIVTVDKYYVGKGDKIIYTPKKEEYNIIGNGFVYEKNTDRKVYGDNIFINQISGEAKVKGSENKPVKFIINIERGEKK